MCLTLARCSTANLSPLVRSDRIGRCRDAAEKGHFCVRHFGGVTILTVVKESACGRLRTRHVARLFALDEFFTQLSVRHVGSRTFFFRCAVAGRMCTRCATCSLPSGRLLLCSPCSVRPRSTQASWCGASRCSVCCCRVSWRCVSRGMSAVRGSCFAW
jgi:hypothetical protein